LNAFVPAVDDGTDAKVQRFIVGAIEHRSVQQATDVIDDDQVAELRFRAVARSENLVAQPVWLLRHARLAIELGEQRIHGGDPVFALPLA
jgi:hypothetical protein